MAERRIIGLAGRKRSGKNTVADFLCEQYNYQPLAFADGVWDVLLAADPWIDLNPGWRLSSIVEYMGREKAKETWPEVRRLLQKLGTEGVRDNIGSDTWLNVVKSKILARPDQDFVITDVRFQNEAQALRDMGGFIVKIERPGVEESYGSQHSSELAVSEIQEDLMIINDSDLEALAGRALDVHEFGR